MEISVEEVRRQLDAGEPLRLVDVRELDEWKTARIEGAVLIPMGSIPAHLADLDQDEQMIVVFCHHGVRSLHVTAWLRARGVENCVSVAGGIDAWSLRVDAEVPRY